MLAAIVVTFAAKLNSWSKALISRLKALRVLDWFVFLSLLATIPALTANSIPSITGLSEEFGWAGFDLLLPLKGGGSFYLHFLWAGITLLLVLLWAFNARLWKRNGGLPLGALLGLLPALILMFTPIVQVGSSMNYTGELPALKVCDAQTLPPGCAYDVAIHLPAWLGMHQFGPPNPKAMEASSEATLIVARQVVDRMQFWWAVPYALACLCCWVFLIWHFGFNRSYLKLVFAIAFLVNCFWGMWQWQHGWIDWLLVAAYPLAMALALFAFLRVLFRLYIDNRDIWATYKGDSAVVEGLPPLGKTVWRSVRYVVPFLVVLVASLGFEWYVTKTASNLAYNADYCEAKIAQFNCAALVPVRMGQRFPRDDTHLAGIARLEFAASKITEAVNEVDPVNFARDARNKVVQAYEEVLPPNVWQLPGLAYLNEGCKPISFKRRPLFVKIDIPCFFRKIKSDIINGIYQSPRNRVLESLVYRMDQAIAQLGDVVPANAEQKKLELIGAMKPIVSNLKEETRQEIDLAFLTYSLYGLVALLLMMFAILRSFYTVLARLLYPQNLAPDRGFFSLVPNAKESDGKVRLEPRKGLKLDIKLENGEVFYVKPNLDVANATRSVALPLQWSKSIFPRLLSRRYFLRHVTADVSHDKRKKIEPNLTDDSGAFFRAIRLSEGQHIAFRWPHLVGLTNNATIDTVLSFRIPLIALGHVRMTTISGPGLVVFKVRGDAQILEDNVGHSESVAQFRLIAWDLDARFRVASSSGFMPMYFDGSQFRVAKDDMAIIDVGQDGRYMPGLIHNLWGVLRP